MSEHTTEQSPTAGNELAVQASGLLGFLATGEMTPGSHQEGGWNPVEGGLQRRVAGVHLGKVLGPDGWGTGFRDESDTPVPEAGLTFRVGQSSTGTTEVSAVAQPGYRVEAGRIDAETGRVTGWDPAQSEALGTRVAADKGNFLSGQREHDKLGNPGTRVGVVRVTGPESDVNYYAMGAQFVGLPDNWQVDGGIVQVYPIEVPSLPGTLPQLPSAE